MLNQPIMANAAAVKGCARWVRRSVSPKALEPIRCERRVSGCVLNVSMSQVGLQRASIMAVIGELVAARVAQHMRMRLDAEICRGGSALHHAGETGGR